MVQVTRMTYARVAADAMPGAPKLREIDDGVNSFLADHIHELRELTRSRRTQPGRFIDQDTQALFRSLLYDGNSEFLAVGDLLTKRLIGLMDGRANPGLLICMTAFDESSLIAGVLKLQVVAEHGAVLKRLETGEETLAAVTDMLDKPGDLQKGVLVSSELAEDQVMTGDRLIPDAAYFPAAFGIRIFSRPAQASGHLLDVVNSIEPDLAADVAEFLPSTPAGELDEVLVHLGRQIPALTPEKQATVRQALEQRPRPVGRVDTGKTATMTIKVGDITVSGPAASMTRRVTVDGPTGRGWQVVVQGSEEPKRSYR